MQYGTQTQGQQLIEEIFMKNKIEIEAINVVRSWRVQIFQQQNIYSYIFNNLASPKS